MTYSADNMPFTVHLNRNRADSFIECERLLRSLPGKRLVCKGTWGGRAVVIKLFLDKKNARRHWTREKNGIEALQKARISTPDPLYSGDALDGTPVLVFDFLAGAISALEQWNTLTGIDPKKLFLLKLVEQVSKLHSAGLVQEDMHLENFLISGEDVFVIDGDAICRRSDRPLDIKTSSRNLALFLAQLPPQFDSLAEPVIFHYAAQRELPVAVLLTRTKCLLPKVRHRRRLKYVKKCYRSCSEFLRSKRPGQVSICRRDAMSENLQRLFDDPERFMRSGEMLKDGNSSTVVRVRENNCDWVIKRYNIKNFWHALSRCFRTTRAWSCWGNAHRMKISGIASPHAIAVIEKRFGPLRSTGYYVCNYQPGVLAGAFFKDKTLDDVIKQQAALNFVELFELLHKLGIIHGDCKATNYLLNDNVPWVLDLDAMHECRFRKNFERLFQVDRRRFLRNWRTQPEWSQWFDNHLPGKRLLDGSHGKGR